MKDSTNVVFSSVVSDYQNGERGPQQGLFSSPFDLGDGWCTLDRVIDVSASQSVLTWDNVYLVIDKAFVLLNQL